MDNLEEKTIIDDGVEFISEEEDVQLQGQGIQALKNREVQAQVAHEIACNAHGFRIKTKLVKNSDGTFSRRLLVRDNNKYDLPHQGKAECKRRLRQREARAAKFDHGVRKGYEHVVNS